MRQPIAGPNWAVAALSLLFALAFALALAPRAAAGQATLWACHGPGGQALGVQPLTAATFGDGVITTYGTGCAAPITALGDGGLRAAFTRVDPAGGSQSFWRFDVPGAVTLQSARLARRTSGFGAAAVPGGGQSYVTQTSAGAIEASSVEDATNVALDGVLDAPASGTYVRFGVQCTKAQLERCAPATGDALGVDASSIALRVSDDTPPRGAVGGVSSPAVGTLGLSLFANDGGLGLASARATLDGALVAVADLGGAACAELSPQDATIDLAAAGGCPLRWLRRPRCRHDARRRTALTGCRSSCATRRATRRRSPTSRSSSATSSCRRATRRR